MNEREKEEDREILEVVNKAYNEWGFSKREILQLDGLVGERVVWMTDEEAILESLYKDEEEEFENQYIKAMQRLGYTDDEIKNTLNVVV